MYQGILDAFFSESYNEHLIIRFPLLLTLSPVDGGDATSPNVHGHGEDLQMVHGASYRQVIDLSSMDSSLFVLGPGQDGNMLSPRYQSLLPLWSQGEYLTMTMKKDDDGHTTGDDDDRTSGVSHSMNEAQKLVLKKRKS